MTADECDRCGCRARTHPIDTCRTFVPPANATGVRCGEGVEPFWCERELGHDGDHFAEVAY